MPLYSFIFLLILPFSEFDLLPLVAQTSALRPVFIYVTVNIIASF